MIVVDCRSRLGNQMFQYAFGLEAAQRLGTDFWMEADGLQELFRLPDRGAAPDLDAYPVARLDNEDYDEPEDFLQRLADFTRYRGFFQSERFFPSVTEEVRGSFRFRAEHEDAFRSRYAELLERPYVCCHVRRTDYFTFAGGVVLPLSYYADCLARLRPARGTPIVFVGDDLSQVRARFGSLPGARFERNEEAVDLQLLVHAEHVVVSNSTFAWWGAWLNARPRRQVLAPRYWLGFNHSTGWHNKTRQRGDRRTRRDWEYPRYVIPESWTRVGVERPLHARVSVTSLRSSAALLANNTLAAVGDLRVRAQQR